MAPEYDQYDLVEDRRVDGVIIGNLFASLWYKTQIFHVAVRLLSNTSQKT